jgi:LPS-assembly protein
LATATSTAASAQASPITAPAQAGAARPPMTARCSKAEVNYDYNNQRVSAVGNVQMFFNGTSVEADKVIYDQKTKRLHAEGNIRLTDAEGKSPCRVGS